METTLIRGGTLLDADCKAATADIVITGNSISRIAPAGTVAGADRVIEATGSLVMPGLVNAHAHSQTNVQRGLFDPMPLELWLPLVIPLTSRVRFDAELVRLSALVGALHMLKRGVTTVLDHWAAPITMEEGLEALAAAYDESGIRAVIGADFSEVPLHEEIPELAPLLPSSVKERIKSAAGSASTYLKVCRVLASRMSDKDRRVHAMLGISAPQRCLPEVLRNLAQLSAETGMTTHCHLLETRLQKRVARRSHPGGLARLLDDAGFLSPRLSVAHAVHVSRADARLLADRGAQVVHCPVSNLKLGSGVMPLGLMRRFGVPLSLGTDGASSNDDLNMFQVAKFAALVHTVAESDYSRWPTAANVLGWATRGGAQAVGLGTAIGSIEAGRRADLILLNLQSSNFAPMNDPVRQVIFGEDGRDVTTVLVDGRVVVAAGECVTLKETDILDQVNAHADRYRGAWEQFRKDAKPVLSALGRVYRLLNSDSEEQGDRRAVAAEGDDAP